MSSTHSDPRSESDPLLEFSSEARDEPPPVADQAATPEATITVADTAPRPAIITVDPAIETLTSRIARLERVVEDGKIQNAKLRSDVETLVRAVADIRTRASRVPAPPAVVPAKPRHRVATAAAAVLLGAAVGVGGWIYASTRLESVTLPATDTVEASSVVDPPPPPVVPASVEVPVAAPDAAPTLIAHHAPQDPVMMPESRELRRGRDGGHTYVGTLSIDADPGGEVFINRETAGHTPLRIANLKAGSHLVWIEREGYRRWTRVVQVPADRVSRVWADLDPIAIR